MNGIPNKLKSLKVAELKDEGGCEGGDEECDEVGHDDSDKDVDEGGGDVEKLTLKGWWVLVTDRWMDIC